MSHYISDMNASNIWTQIFHGIPHLDFNGYWVDELHPGNPSYEESLYNLGFLPLGILIVTMLGIEIYIGSLYSRKQRSQSTLRVIPIPIRIRKSLCLLSFGFALSLSVGFLGNCAVHSAISERQRGLSLRFTDILNRNYELSQRASSLLDIQQGYLSQDEVMIYGFNGSMDGLQDFLINESYVVRTGIDAAKDSQGNWLQHTLKLLPLLDDTEAVRWTSTIVLQVLCVFYSFAVIFTKSPTSTALYAFLGLFVLFWLWCFTSVYLLSTVALSDFCNDPRSWILEMANKEYCVSKDILSYYLDCQKDALHPYNKELQKSFVSIEVIGSHLKWISIIHSDHVYPKNITRTEPLVKVITNLERLKKLTQSLDQSLKCDDFYKYYSKSIGSFCEQALPGMTVVLLSLVICAALSTVMICLNFKTFLKTRPRFHYESILKEVSCRS